MSDVLICYKVVCILFFVADISWEELGVARETFGSVSHE